MERNDRSFFLRMPVFVTYFFLVREGLLGEHRSANTSKNSERHINNEGLEKRASAAQQTLCGIILNVFT